MPAETARRRLSSQTRLLLWVDRYIGAPVCFVLTVLRGLSVRQRGQRREPLRILFLKLAEQGSTVLAHDALLEAVRRVGRENVYFLAFEENRFVVDLLGVIPAENVLAIRTARPARMASSTWELLRRIRRLRIDACIDMEFFARSSAVLGFLTGARVRVGFHTYFGEGPYRGNLLTHRVLYNPHLHTGDTFLSLVKALDLEPEQLPTFDFKPGAPAPLPQFQPTPQERETVRAMIAGGAHGPHALSTPSAVGGPAHRDDARHLILLNANCSDLLPLRKWPDENYVALARALLDHDPELAVAFTGSPEEAPRVSELAASVGSPRAFSLAGRTTLRELLVLYCLADILITNDSGPAHFAALTPIDVVALFGPETPLLFAARGPRSHPVWLGIACSPCVNAFNSRQSACRDNVCMQGISVERVAALAASILAQRTATASSVR